MHERSTPAWPARGRVFFLVLAASLMLGLGGCQTAREPDVLKTAGWENHHLANAARPYAKLLVEIDAVEGAEPSAKELAEMKAFLARATNKPGGITLKLDNIIPKSKARGRTPESLALEFLNGPSDEDTAFIYVLCYRSRITRLFGKAENPYFTYFPYPCAVFINRSYASVLTSLSFRARTMLLQHELGHALGLAFSDRHSRAGHCTDEDCLMSPSLAFHYLRLLTFRSGFDQKDICAQCRRDLETYRTANAADNARLWHGYFVRSGEGYHLLTLPGLVYVHFGDLGSLDVEKLATLRRKILRGPVDGWRIETEFALPEATDALCRFISRESDVESMRELIEELLNNIATTMDATRGEERREAVAVVRRLLPSAAKFPAIQARFLAISSDETANASESAGDDPVVGVEGSRCYP